MLESPHDSISRFSCISFAADIPRNSRSGPSIEWLSLSLLLLELWIELCHVLHSVPRIAVILKIIFACFITCFNISGIIDQATVFVFFASIVDIVFKCVKDLSWRYWYLIRVHAWLVFKFCRCNWKRICVFRKDNDLFVVIECNLWPSFMITWLFGCDPWSCISFCFKLKASDWTSSWSIFSLVANSVFLWSIWTARKVVLRACSTHWSYRLSERSAITFTADTHIFKFLLDYRHSSWLIIALVLVIVHASVINLQVMLPGRHVPRIATVTALNCSAPELRKDWWKSGWAILLISNLNLCQWSHLPIVFDLSDWGEVHRAVCILW